VRKITIVTVGKCKERWLQEAVAEYERRIAPRIKVEWKLVRTAEQLFPTGRALALDAAGDSLTSRQFHQRLFRELELGGSRLTLVIGAAEGLPPKVKAEIPLISLSPMTFTHQTTRLLLLEQIYRACEIEKGSGYEK
jgi:23S rRNA (pseudouridine1915-N3)-methyltransferase